MGELQRWTIMSGRFTVRGHNGYTADLIEKFPTQEAAMAFGHRLLARSNFDRVVIRDGMATSDGPSTWTHHH